MNHKNNTIPGLEITVSSIMKKYNLKGVETAEDSVLNYIKQGDKVTGFTIDCNNMEKDMLYVFNFEESKYAVYLDSKNSLNIHEIS